MRCLVTGAGLVGSAVSDRLVADGHTVVLLDRVPKPPPARGRFVVGDLTDPVAVDRALVADGAPVDGVIHTAALHGWIDADPRAFFDANVVGTWTLYERAAAAGVDRVVLASTVGVYGQPPPPIGPDTPATATAGAYEATKRMAEDVARFWAGRGVRTVALRYGGIRQMVERAGRIPPAWARSGALVDLDDVVAMTVRALERLPLPRAAYVVAPSGGGPDSPYRVDASATERDLELRFRHGYDEFAAAAGSPA